MNNSGLFCGCPDLTHALLSIKPRFAKAILRGQKKYEFRRRVFARRVDVVMIYVTAPVRLVVGEFDVVSVITESPSSLWERTRPDAGIDEVSFRAYFEGCDYGHAMVIGEVRRYATPFCPVKRLGIQPPQSYVYVDPASPDLARQSTIEHLPPASVPKAASEERSP